MPTQYPFILQNDISNPSYLDLGINNPDTVLSNWFENKRKKELELISQQEKDNYDFNKDLYTNSGSLELTMQKDLRPESILDLKKDLYDKQGNSEGDNQSNNQLMNYLSMLGGQGIDLQSSLFLTGAGLNFDKAAYANPELASTGNTIRTIGAIGNSLLKGAKDIFSGMAYQNKTNNTLKSYREKQRQSMVGNYMEQGGQINDTGLSLEKLLTGDFATQVPNGMEGVANSELEGGEYIQHPDGNIQEVVGNKHSQGGVKMALDNGTQVVSDKNKIGSKLASKLKDELGVSNLKASDTFADVIEKFDKTLGYNKIVSEQEELIKKLEKQKEVSDKSTNNVNLMFLSKKINELENKKQELNKIRENVVNNIYQLQEQSKGKPNNADNKMAEGGQISDEMVLQNIANKFGVGIDEVKSMLEQYDISLPKYEGGGDTGDPKNKKKQVNSIFIDNYTPVKLSDKDKELLLNYYSKFLDPKIILSMKNGSIDMNKLVYNKDLLNDLRRGQNLDIRGQHRAGDYFGQVDSERINNFTLKDYVPVYLGKEFDYKDAEGIGKLQEKYGNDFKSLFGFDYKSGIDTIKDNKFGNVTSSYVRTTAVVPAKEHAYIDLDRVRMLLKEKNGKQLVDNMLKEKGTSFNAIKDKVENSVYKIAELKAPDKSTADKSNKQVEKPADKSTNNTKDIINNSTGGNDLGYMLLPNQYTIAPDGVDPHLKIDRRFDRIDPVKVSPEQNIKELFRVEGLSADALQNMPDAMRKAGLSNLTANTEESLNKVITDIDRINSQNQQFADKVNLSQSNLQENMRASDALSFERRQLLAKAKTEEQLQKWFDHNIQVGVANFNLRNKQQLFNSMFENYKLNGMGGVGVQGDSPNLYFDPLKYQNSTNKKKKG